MARIGFTGTRAGMTDVQIHSVWELLKGPELHTVHHGDCVGADEQFHSLAHERGHSVVIHPPENSTLRAWCEGAEEVRDPYTYMDRNQHIVRGSNYLIAAPKEHVEKRRGGTWATVRMAYQLGVPVYLVLPNGIVQRT